MSDYDITIIGSGAAGLSAALVLSRARRRVLVLDGGTPRNAPAAHMHGFLSRDGVPPADLLDAGREEIARYGAQIREARATSLVPDGADRIWVITEDGGRIRTRRVLVATGLRDELPQIPGLADRWARDVLHCPYCHGWEVANQRLGVLGWSPEAPRYAQIVRQWSTDITYLASPDNNLSVADRAAMTARGITVIDAAIAALVIDDDRLRGVELDDGCVTGIDALFVPPRFVPHSDLLRELGAEFDPRGWIAVDPTGRTSARNVWAAGNVVDPRAQVITAAGQGSAAAIAINADLIDEDVRVALDVTRHGLLPTN
ncbi:NAD(P)/FAD-dependent oxidoreductase [Jatrophihabitans telluris]|uniref:NAD(P)/FAD-dependent oxidoreductase n=1 Tax=Jatrophihabitans telluris TaxID=2038343 RepID=A0ABY4QVC5_9ACTN|nr:NAD(P)/FAD-dependent oxidoreductase [Jatrophihabitans telluris]UQX87072.1 NAD(P)/FAD-dependent oxidoreductase [Jatrophihabitans telluris]